MGNHIPRCPATMCPLIAPKGSPWTGQKDAECSGAKCGWFHERDGCLGQAAALEQVEDVLREGSTLQIGPGGNKFHKRKPIDYDCKRASECQWQRERGERLCPPRQALKVGLPRRSPIGLSRRMAIPSSSAHLGLIVLDGTPVPDHLLRIAAAIVPVRRGDHSDMERAARELITKMGIRK